MKPFQLLAFSLLLAAIGLLFGLLFFTTQDFSVAIALTTHEAQLGELSRLTLEHTPFPDSLSEIRHADIAQRVNLMLVLLERRLSTLSALGPLLLLGLFAAIFDGALSRKTASETFEVFSPLICSGGFTLAGLVASLSFVVLGLPISSVKEVLTSLFVLEAIALGLALRHLHRLNA